ncbi:PREDICTED: 60S ribosomal protein L22-like [Thamnophis sirtalis]|uniref:Large ribosomal subunit protein eL22 n=1 Tax=Thamnophis sirtalis TaxID=35019 RepID=A0A6I9Z646_9SAUR|nr:PREDICTED: 60S ribosomal protein L22-like [Thamnophis sirtalis]
MTQSKFTLDCTHPVQDGVMDTGNFEQFLEERIKVNSKAGNFGRGAVTIDRSKSKITVTSKVQFSKGYLTKKDLKKNNLCSRTAPEEVRTGSNGSLENHLKIFRSSLEDLLKIIGRSRRSLENHLKIFSGSLENHLKIFGRSLENHLKIFRRSLEVHWKTI